MSHDSAYLGHREEGEALAEFGTPCADYARRTPRQISPPRVPVRSRTSAL
jgi:hypothetical protein